MKARWFVPALLLVTAAPAQAQFAIDITVGPNWSSLSAVPSYAPGASKSSDIGYFLGGRIRFGGLFYIAPGLNYQYQSVKLETTSVSDNIGISSFMIPLEVGVNLNAKIVAVQLGVAGTVAFNSSVNDNEFATFANKDNTNNTRWGWMLNGSARILMLQLNLQYQADFTDTFKDDPAGAKLSQFRLGLGIGF
jgi:hypothetical protein